MSTGNADVAESGVPERKAGFGKMGKSIATLGVATAVDIFVQVAIPIVLVRVMSGADFGLYRTLWLIASTAPGVLALGMPVSLYYFLPRLEPSKAGAIVLQTAGHMAVAGLVAALGTAVYLYFQSGEESLGYGAVAFVGLWMFASLLDFMFVAQQKVPIQVRINLSFAALRVVLVLGAAYLFGSWPAVLAAHIAVVAIKAVVCVIVVRRFAGPDARPSRESIVDQYRYALPLGGSTALYALRGRLDQWLVASLFSASQFGLYSIAAVFAPLQTLIRVTVNQVVQPELSRLQSEDDIEGMRKLGRRSNLAVALLMFPAVAFIGLWAEGILSVLFTDKYSGAAPVVRIYLLTMVIESLDIAMVLAAMRQGRYLMRVDAIALPAAIGAALLGAQHYGMTGAAIGGVVGALTAQVLLYIRFGRLTHTPLSEIQDWSAIARVVLASVLAGLLSWAALLADLPGGMVSRLIVAGALFSAAYWLALNGLGLSDAVRQVLGEKLARLTGFAR
jgi:O-antigen/teichoic acid export membrane protein